MAPMGKAFLVMMVVVIAMSLPLVQGKTQAPVTSPVIDPSTSIAAPPSTSSVSSPAPGPTSDGTSIDQGIAYVLMLVALVLTYLIHPLDASSPYRLF